MALTMVEICHHLLFLNGSRALRGPGRRDVSPGVVTAGHHAQHLAKLLDRVASALLVHEMQLTHGVGGCEKMAPAFFKIFSSCASWLLATRGIRIPAALAGSVGNGRATFCHA